MRRNFFFVLALLPLSQVAGVTIISGNFVGGTGNGATDPSPIASTAVAGLTDPTILLTPVANWNNLTTNTGTANPLVDQFGAATGATVTYTSSNSWRIGGAPADGNAAIMNGYLDTNNSAGSTNVTVNNLPVGAGVPYAVVLYLDGGSSDGSRAGDYTVNGVAQTDLRDNSNWPITTAGGGTFVQATTGNGGNYALFRGITTGSTITINADEFPGGFRAPLNAFQIIVPEPSRAFLILIGLTLTIARRRRP